MIMIYFILALTIKLGPILVSMHTMVLHLSFAYNFNAVFFCIVIFVVSLSLNYRSF